jgi:chromosome segregation ATPase
MMQRETTNGHEAMTHVSEASLTRFNQRLAEVEERSTHAVMVLQNATAEFFAREIAPRDQQIAELTAENAALHQKVADLDSRIVQATVETQVGKIAARLAEETARHDQQIADLTDENVDLEQRLDAAEKHAAELAAKLAEKAAVDLQVEEIIKRLDARQLARDQAKKGAKGERGERGEKGATGARGPAGKPGKPAPTFHSWHVDRKKFRVTVFFTDGTSLEPLDLMPLFEAYHNIAQYLYEG